MLFFSPSNFQPFIFFREIEKKKKFADLFEKFECDFTEKTQFFFRIVASPHNPYQLKYIIKAAASVDDVF